MPRALRLDLPDHLQVPAARAPFAALASPSEWQTVDPKVGSQPCLKTLRDGKGWRAGGVSDTPKNL